jgi:hypothetical protein
MWMSVPQMAVLPTLIRISLWPTSGTGISSIQIPTSGFAFTNAFIFSIFFSLFSLSDEIPYPTRCISYLTRCIPTPALPVAVRRAGFEGRRLSD